MARKKSAARREQDRQRQRDYLASHPALVQWKLRYGRARYKRLRATILATRRAMYRANPDYYKGYAHRAYRTQPSAVRSREALLRKSRREYGEYADAHMALIELENLVRALEPDWRERTAADDREGNRNTLIERVGYA